jgi:hypothetical protein
MDSAKATTFNAHLEYVLPLSRVISSDDPLRSQAAMRQFGTGMTVDTAVVYGHLHILTMTFFPMKLLISKATLVMGCGDP